ncbi:hypothetical protein [Azospirillum argentinense]|uniref:hypothetical protein n=1 Tax=Azospirillum argentinense TaxID=2970906 RepID=UPI0032DEAF02
MERSQDNFELEDIDFLERINGEKSEALSFLVAYTVVSLKINRFSAVSAIINLNKEMMVEFVRDGLRSSASADELASGMVESYYELAKEMWLVYAVAAFDSFLNSATSYLFNLYPAKIIGDAEIEVRQLLSKGKAEVINSIISKKVSAASRDSFSQRIRLLEGIVGESFSISSDDMSAMKELVKDRNLVIHERDAFSFSLDDALNVIRNAPKKNIERVHLRSLLCLNRIACQIYRIIIIKSVKRNITERELALLDAIECNPYELHK